MATRLELNDRTAMKMGGKTCLNREILWSHRTKSPNDSWNVAGKLNGGDSATDFYGMDHEQQWSSVKNLPRWINTVDGARMGIQFQSTLVRLKPSLSYEKVTSIPSTYMLYTFSILFLLLFIRYLDFYISSLFTSISSLKRIAWFLFSSPYQKKKSPLGKLLKKERLGF